MGTEDTARGIRISISYAETRVKTERKNPTKISGAGLMHLNGIDDPARPRKKKDAMWRYLSVFLLCALGGGILGRGAAPRAEGDYPSSARDAEPATRHEAPAKWGKKDFLKAAGDFSAAIKAGSYDPYKGLFATWTDAEIRAALDQCVVHPDCLTTNGPGMGLANSLLKELLKRDTDAAVGWFDSIALDAAKRRYVYTISASWPEDKAAAGLDFLRNHRAFFPGSIGWSIMAKNIQASAAQGPAGVDAMLKKMKEDGFSLDFQNPIRFPEGFDFPALVNGGAWQQMEPGGVREGILRAFRQQDPERAFVWLLEKSGVDGIGLTGWNPMGVPDFSRFSWLGKKIEALDATQQAEYFEKTQGEWMQMPDTAVASFAKDVTSPGTRELLRGSVVQQIYAGNVRGSLAALEALGDPEERLHALEEATPGKLFEGGHRPLTPGDEALIKGKLAAWNANEARIQSIIDQLKK